ncbi:MAG: hypothetical protein H7235_10825 [Bdellovibrionaceae bacterium]|nr:hypothetical protein [Pseudobdellovibrionaceae bacterium]
MKSLAILFLLLIAATEVFAQSARPPSTIPPRRKPVLTNDEDYSAVTYDMYVPRPGSNYLTLGISLLSYEDEVRATSVKTKGSGYGINMNYSHGITTSFAYFISQDIYGYKYDITPNLGTSQVNTLGPTLIGLKGMKTYLGSFFYYSAGYQAAILENRDDQSGLNVFSESDRRDNIQLAGGFGALLGGFSLGAQYTYFIYQETDNIFSNVATKYKAGTGARWKLYAQLENRYKLGFAYGEETIDSADTSTGGVLTKNGYSKYEYQRLQIYTIIPVSATTDFYADLTRTDRKNVSTYYSKFEFYLATAAIRISF